MAVLFLINSFVFFLCSFFLVCSTSLIQSNETLPFSALFVFGDSTVDAGNNDYLVTITKCNFPPYGRDFIDHKATGRFCNGKLTTDFIVEALGLKETMPPYLDPALSAQDIVTGVTFASGGSGYDNLTADLTSVLPVWKQVQLFKSYRKRLTEIVGYKNASDIIRNALFVCSMGTNDFVFTYSAQPIRRAHMNVEQYQDFLLQGANGLIQELYKEGARSLAFVGIPPMGCLPLVRTLNLKQNIDKRIGKTECLEEQNQVAVSYNEKLQSLLQTSMRILPDVKLVYVDIYNVLYDMIQNPEKHGFEVTDEGCCGTGLIEAGPLCNKNTPIICSDASKYVFWDSIHPTEKAYEIVAQEVVDRDLQQFFF